MTVLRSNFEGGPDGTTLTVGNSGQGEDDPFDQVTTTGTGIVLQYASTATLNRQTAEFAMKLSTGSIQPNPASPCVHWTTSLGSQTQIWTRFYVYFTAASVAATDQNLFSISNTIDGKANVSVWLRNAASPFYLAIYNANTAAITYMSTTPITLGVWHRIEFQATISNTAGTADLYFYSGNNADGDTYDDTVSMTGQNFFSTAGNRVSLGMWHGSQANTPVTYFSNWEVNNSGYPGPAPFRVRGVPGILTNPFAIHSDVG